MIQREGRPLGRRRGLVLTVRDWMRVSLGRLLLEGSGSGWTRRTEERGMEASVVVIRPDWGDRARLEAGVGTSTLGQQMSATSSK